MALNAPKLDQFDEGIGSGDFEVNNPQLGRMNREDRKDVWLIRNSVDHNLQLEAISIERERTVHVTDTDPAMEKADHGLHHHSLLMAHQSSLLKVLNAKHVRVGVLCCLE